MPPHLARTSWVVHVDATRQASPPSWRGRRAPLTLTPASLALCTACLVQEASGQVGVLAPTPSHSVPQL